MKGIIFEYVRKDGTNHHKDVNLLDLTSTSDTRIFLNRVLKQVPSLSKNSQDQVTKLIDTLKDKLKVEETNHDFYQYKILRAHILPLTNCAFNKGGDKFITGSYDRTCKVWDTTTGEELLSLEGHRNVVYAIAFNNPYGDKIITGSFDKTCKLWNAQTGENIHTYRGHETEIVCLNFCPQGTLIATGSMDNTARLWDVETGHCLHTLLGHTGEIVSVNFDTHGKHLITGSFDHTIKLWDTRNGKVIHSMQGHKGEISSTQFNYKVRFEYYHCNTL